MFSQQLIIIINVKLVFLSLETYLCSWVREWPTLDKQENIIEIWIRSIMRYISSLCSHNEHNDMC